VITEKINEEELEFLEFWHNPQCLTECLWHDFDNLASFDAEKFGNIRTYQIPFLSWESLIDTEISGLSQKEKFNLRKGAGDCYLFGGRKFGKSMIALKIDIPLSLLYDGADWCAFTSIDAIHMDGILDPVKDAVENHPVLKCWTRMAKKSPWRIFGKNGWKLYGVNMGVLSSSPGKHFYGLHVKKMYGEEMSLETQSVYEKRQDSLSEVGAVMRLSGMTNFTRHSPAGKSFYEPENKNKIINLPQYVNPLFDENDDKDRLKEFGGQDSLNYRVFVKGEIVEDGVSEFDMDRIAKCINEKIEIKNFEINKEKFNRYKNIIIAERPKNAERIFLCADIGESAGSELIVISETKEKYNYLYNITLTNLTHIEQLEIFKYLINILKANVVALDCGDGTGRAIYRELEKLYPKENLVWYDGSMKIAVDFAKDEKGNIKIEKGKPITLEEFMSEWSVRRLKTLFYEEKMKLPKDYKFEVQISSVMAFQSGTRTTYKCVSQQDHLFDSFKVFAIAEWLCASHLSTPTMTTDWGIGSIG
jgi:hypothetical protein